MVARETVSFVFPRVLKHQDSRENKTNQFPEGPYIKCFVIYLEFIQQKQANKDGMRATTAQVILSLERTEHELEIWLINFKQSVTSMLILKAKYIQKKRSHKVHHFTCISGFKFDVCVKLCLRNYNLLRGTYCNPVVDHY